MNGSVKLKATGWIMVVVCLIMGIKGIGNTISFHSERKMLLRDCTESTPAQVTEIEIMEEKYYGKGSEPHYRRKYRAKILADNDEFGGIEFYTDWKSKNEIKEGEKVTLKYDPDNITKYYIEEHFPNKAKYSAIGTAASFAIGGGILFLLIKKRG